MDQNKQFQLALNQCKTINLKKLKIDTFLLVIHFLLKDYEKIDPNKIPDPMTICASEEEILFINSSVGNLKNYLENNIIISDTLFSIFNEQNKSPLFDKISRNLEPMKIYYKYLINTFSSKLKNGSNWIPELLAFSLIYNYKKEHDKSFNSYPELDNLPIEKIVSIYNKNNLELKKRISNKDGISRLKVKTDIDEMYDVSEVMVMKYLQYTYKINASRQSKNRDKKKKR
jgi:hypothetical protein